jgi:hypothetical protein
MPDLRGLALGGTGIVISTAQGAKSIVLDANGTPMAPDNGQMTGDHCLFTGLQHVLLAPADAEPLHWPVLGTRQPITRIASALPPNSRRTSTRLPRTSTPLLIKTLSSRALCDARSLI